MKQTLKIVLTIIILCAAHFQGVAQDMNTGAIDRAKLKYNMALMFNDYSEAKGAIYDLMALEPNNSAYLDSLAFMYFEFRQYASSALASNEALKYNPRNSLLLQVAAQSFDQLGATDKALNAYQRLYNITDDAFVLFEIANKQYTIKNYDEAMINTELLLGKQAVNVQQVMIKNSEDQDVEVPFKAVVHNLQGLIAKDQGNAQDAKKYFNSALKIAPNYALAKENLNAMN